LRNTSGVQNIAVETDALVFNDIAVGAFALFNNTEGANNTAIANIWP